MAVFLFFIAISPAFSDAIPRLGVIDGVIDLGSRTTPVELVGTWAFWPSVFVNPSVNAHDFPRFEKFPASWSSYPPGALPGRGYGSYALRITGLDPTVRYGIRFPGYSCATRYFVDGKEIYASGTPSESRAGEVPRWDTAVVPLPRSSRQDMILVLHISNHNDIFPASPVAVQIGSFDVLAAAHSRARSLMIIPLAAILAMGAYFIALYVFQREERAALWLGILCANFALRISCYDEFLLQDLLPFVPTSLMFRFGYLTFALASVGFAGFLRALYPGEMGKVPAIAIVSCGVAYSVASLATPIDFFTALLVPFQAFTLAGSLYLIFVVVLAAFRRRLGAPLFLAGFCFLFLMAFHDILIANRQISGSFLSHFGILGIVAAMALVVVIHFARAAIAVEAATDELAKVNASLVRFVPGEFLKFLGKRSITEVCLGDNILKDMCVMFVHLGIDVPLTGAAARLNMLEMFNNTLRLVNPVIARRHGFIDKYLAEGVMVLFPDDPANAVGCAIEMRRAIEAYNVERTRDGLPGIRFAAGIHRGSLMLGTIGEAERMDSTVISDAVNTASRLLRFALSKGASVIASEPVALAAGLAPDGGVSLVPHGEVRLKGRDAPISVFEVGTP